MTRRVDRRLSAVAALAAIALAGGARAADVLFTITETGEIETFKISESPVPLLYIQSVLFETITSNYIYNGITFPGSAVIFYSSYYNGGLDTGGPGDISIVGSQYYTGNESSPTFTTGTYADQDDYYQHQSATVTITAVPAVPGVPEPAAWTLMLAGFGALGGALRARSRSGRAWKLRDYAEAPSVGAYVLLAQTAVPAAPDRREARGPWIAAAHTNGEIILPGVGVTLPFADCYAGLEFSTLA